jgi:rhodanese-related sulfurtransferase
MENSICQEMYDTCIKTHEISDEQLQHLLTCKEDGQLDFLLVDIREMFEYTNLSIKGTDLLIPTSIIHEKLSLLEREKDKFIVLYCRTGNRTSFTMFALKRMGFTKIAHLSDGIVSYTGETKKNAPLPNKF